MRFLLPLVVLLGLSTAACSGAPAPSGGEGEGEGEDQEGAAEGEDGEGEGGEGSDDGAGIGEECSFHDDCQLALRCACSGFSCACEEGARGTLAFGEACEDGISCQSNVCLEGPTDGETICSQECEDEEDCGGDLPLCLFIELVGQVCVRTPPEG